MRDYLNSLRPNQDVLYQAKTRNQNNTIRVFILSISPTKKTAIVETMGDIKIEFQCRTSSLFF